MKLFCDHKYECIKNVNVYYGEEDKYPYKTYSVYLCCKCLKKKKVKT